MKTTLWLTLTLLTFMTLVFLPDSFAQVSSPEYVVRVIYFLPNDRQPKPDIDKMLDSQIKEAQRFFADQLEAHGFDRKTFRIETDGTGNAIVHHVNGQHDDAYYQNPSIGGSTGAVDEIAEQFDMSKNIYYIVLDSSSNLIDGRGITGWASGNGVNGVAFVTAFEKVPTIHELGHAFGLDHDYRPDFKAKRIYTKLDFRELMTTSFCAAEWLDANRYFNSAQPDVDAPSTIHMLPPQLESPPNVIRLRFEVSDNNGVHQVQLSGSTPYARGVPGLIACESVKGSRHSTVEFIFNPIRRESYVTLSVIDLYGNLRGNAYSIDLTALVPNPAPVSIPDLNLAAAVRNSLVDLNANNPITQLDMISLTRLIAENTTQITDLTGLEHAVSVSYLGLNNNRISDLTPLTGLTYLSDLHLHGNQISNLTPLAGLTHLDTLVLSSNSRISNLTPLAGLTDLWQLHLYGNQISDIAPLAGFTHLWSLYLYNNQISDLTPLAKLTQLVHLGLGNNQISDIAPLAELTQLGHLGLGNNQISDITTLRNLTNLQGLRLSSNQISDITTLRNLTNLRKLHLQSNQITDVSPLVGLVNLEELYLAGNPIEDLAPLQTLLANNPNLKIDIDVPPATSLTFSPNTIADQTFTVGEVVNLALPIATGGAAPYTYTLAPLPGGLSFNATERELSGTPTTVETTTATYTATDANGTSASLTFTITVQAKPTFNPNVIADQTFTVGKPVNLTLPIATGGTPPYTYTLTPLPGGLSFRATERVLSGTPTMAETTTTTYTLTDAANVSASLTFTIDVILDLDVNGDGQVTVLDLAIVALFYGVRVPDGLNLPADVNADGIVNILDLTAVAQGIDAAGGIQGFLQQEIEAALLAVAEQAAEIEAIAEAPNASSRGNLAYHNVAAALTDAKHLATSDVHLKKGVRVVLEELLQLLTKMKAIPETSALLPNYPNPFNPETWIPYQLAEAADVTLTIYAVDGTVVRTLALGHQPIGIYQGKSRAAYWDGKNELGEPVASGVYFYTLTAGEFIATRKMLIRK